MTLTANFNSLTSKQKKVYSAIETYIRMKGIPPTVREIGEMIGEKTPGAVQGILNRLEQKGVLKRQLGAARSIQLVTPDSQMYTDPVYLPEIKKISKRNIDDLSNIYNVVRYHPVSPELVPSCKGCLIVNCADDDLAEANIFQGDTLIIDPKASPVAGDIVLALYDTHVLLRYYYPGEEEGMLTLRGNTTFIDKEAFGNDEVRIIGRLSAKLNRY
jgi:repressor LexA